MAGEDEQFESDSVKSGRESEFKCVQCRKKVVEPVECYKCSEIFHPKCMDQAAGQKSTICKHEEGNIRKLAREINELRNEKDILSIELTYIKELLKESREKNRILMENNALLKNHTEDVEKTDNLIKVKNVNKEKSGQYKDDNKSQSQDTRNEKNNEMSYAKKTVHRILELPSHRTDAVDTSKSQKAYVNVERQISINNKQTSAQDGEWTTIIRNKNKTKPRSEVICTGSKKTTNSIIKGAAKRKWIYVGRIQGKDITEKQIKDYLGEMNQNEEIEVKKLNTQGSNSAFSVGVQTDELFKSICSPEIWPEGVIVREFSFRNLFQKPGTRRRGAVASQFN